MSSDVTDIFNCIFQNIINNSFVEKMFVRIIKISLLCFDSGMVFTKQESEEIFSKPVQSHVIVVLSNSVGWNQLRVNCGMG